MFMQSSVGSGEIEAETTINFKEYARKIKDS